MSTLLRILVASIANYVFSLSRNFQQSKRLSVGEGCTTQENKCWKLYPAILQHFKQPMTIIFSSLAPPTGDFIAWALSTWAGLSI